MSKRDEAYRLFKEGKRPGDPEVDALGLKSKTVKGYLSVWRTIKEAEEAKEAGLPPPPKKMRTRKAPSVSSLQPQQLFMFQGQKYRLRCFEGDRVHVLLVALHPSGQYEVEQCGRYLDKDTPVTLI